MLPSYYLQLFNSFGNLVEMFGIVAIAVISYRNNQNFITRSDVVRNRLDRLISLSKILRKLENKGPVLDQETNIDPGKTTSKVDSRSKL